MDTETLSSSQHPAVGPAEVIRRVAAVCSLGAAAIHFGVAGEHFAEWWVFGVFFLALGAFQVAWSLAAWTRADRRVLLAGLVVSLLTVLLWVITRTTGLPFGPDAHVAEDVGTADVICAALEVVQVALLALLVLRRHPTRLLSPMPAVAIPVVAGMLVLGGAGVALSAPMEHSEDSAGDAAGGNGNRTEMSDLPDVSTATAAQTAAARRFLDQTEAAIARYVDPDAARSDGYDVDAAIRRWHQKHTGKAADAVIPALHVRNPALRDDTAVADPTRPETVIYLRTASGDLLLEGVMYTAGTSASKASQDETSEQPPDIAGPYTRWHYHESCVPKGQHHSSGGERDKVKPGSDGECPDGAKLRRTGYMMHVWNVADDDLVHAYAMSAPTSALMENAEATHSLSAAQLDELRRVASQPQHGKHRAHGEHGERGEQSGHEDMDPSDPMT